VWNDRLAMLEHEITFLTVDKTTTLYQELRMKLQDQGWISTILLAEQLQADLIWSDLPPVLSLYLKISIVSTQNLQDFVQKIPQVLDIQAEEISDTLTSDYNNYGEKSNFNWLEDDRLDPMFYERFLHFYGLKCLNDGKIYYLNPEEKNQLSLPDIVQLDENTRVLRIKRDDTGSDEIYNFEIYEAILSQLHYYWQLFIQQDDSGNFKEGGQAIKKDDDNEEKLINIHVREELFHHKSPPKKFTLKEYTNGSDIFTTGLGFSEFSLPKDIIEMTPEDAIEYFGIDLKTLGKEYRSLKIGDRIFGIKLLGTLGNDVYFDDINKDCREDWEKKYDFFFEADR
jgi:hypothetical protein